jgi:hypothetical protein
MGAGKRLHKTAGSISSCNSIHNPHFWIKIGRSVRVVLAGSNQAEFETTLNRTYTECIYYVVPMGQDEDMALSTLKRCKLEANDAAFYCNYVP